MFEIAVCHQKRKKKKFKQWNLLTFGSLTSLGKMFFIVLLIFLAICVEHMAENIYFVNPGKVLEAIFGGPNGCK